MSPHQSLGSQSRKLTSIGVGSKERRPLKLKGGTTAYMLLYLALFSVVLGSCSARELSTRSGLESQSKLADSGLNVKVTVDVSKTHSVAPNL